MSLRRVIKNFGFKDFVQMGVAAATSRKMAKPVVPKNEALRRVKVAETGIIGQDLSSQFEIFGEMVKLVTGADFSMVNILDGKNQFTIGGSVDGLFRRFTLLTNLSSSIIKKNHTNSDSFSFSSLFSQ